MARELVGQGRKERALLALKRRKLQEGQAAKLDAWLLNVEQMVGTSCLLAGSAGMLPWDGEACQIETGQKPILNPVQNGTLRRSWCCRPPAHAAAPSDASRHLPPSPPSLLPIT